MKTEELGWAWDRTARRLGGWKSEDLDALRTDFYGVLSVEMHGQNLDLHPRPWTAPTASQTLNATLAAD